MPSLTCRCIVEDDEDDEGSFLWKTISSCECESDDEEAEYRYSSITETAPLGLVTNFFRGGRGDCESLKLSYRHYYIYLISTSVCMYVCVCM